MEHLQKNIQEIVDSLRDQGRTVLAGVIDNNWDTAINEYTQYLRTHSTDIPLEPELANAFYEELELLGYNETEITNILAQLERERWIQTSPHVDITQGPRMLCIDWLSTRGSNESEYYIVGAFSGVPFSNNSRPGRIEMDGMEYNFLPKTMQDTLVYGSNIPNKSVSVYESLPQDIQKYIPRPVPDESFSTWALTANTRITQRLLDNTPVVFLDINRVITRYLLAIIDKEGHPIHRMLFDDDIRKKILESFGTDIHFFYTPYPGKHYEKQEKLYLEGRALSGEHVDVSLSPKLVEHALLYERMCAATLITFTVLSFCNGFKCFGSFRQVEYLSRFKEYWKGVGLFEQSSLDKVPTNNLTTGMFPENTHTSTLDRVSLERPFHDPTAPLGELLVPGKDILLS